MKDYKYENSTKVNTRTQLLRTLQDQAFETNISDILELVHFTDDIVLLTKAFYSLGLYLLSQETGCDEIIKCRFLYDKILLVLNSCLQTKVCVALDFVTILLSFGDEQGYSKRRTLHIYVQNLIRTSGCLAAMCNLFTNCMMQRGPLRSLCLSLSMSGRWLQAHCAHLVPLCVTKCSQEHTELYLLLQSLLADNDRHIQLFHECNGMTLFTRESLHYPECLFLLSTIVENTSHGNVTILNRSQVFQIVEDLLLKFGQQSMIGQWSSIILYSKRKGRIDLEIDVPNPKTKKKYGPETNILEHKKFTHNDDDTTKLFRNVYREVMTLQRENNINNKKFTNPCLNNSERVNYNETLGYKFKPIKQFTKKHTNERGSRIMSPRNIEKHILSNNKTVELSFSFLGKMKEETFTNERTFDNVHTNEINSRNIREQLKNRNYFRTQTTNMTRPHKLGNDTIYFKPLFISTPKKTQRLYKTRSSSSCFITNRTLSSIQKRPKLNTSKKNVTKQKINRTITNKSQNQTMSTKFFNLINGSCTTLVKSFANIKNLFKRKNDTQDITVNAECTKNRSSCSYSFTEFMHNIDNNEKNESKELDISQIECNTCNDTSLLRQKLANDKSLQQTVKRLKVGINFYGCDFKRISRTMWPRETYMTPSVLYNLYRKLLVK